MRKLLLFFLLLRCFGVVICFCVLDSKKGWWLDCGIRDSYLFRIKDWGGIQANFDVGFGLGDEKGFPNSISKTNQKAKGPPNYLPPPPTYPSGYGHPHAGYQRRRDDNRVRNRKRDFPYPFDPPRTTTTQQPATFSPEKQYDPQQTYHQKYPQQPSSRPQGSVARQFQQNRWAGGNQQNHHQQHYVSNYGNHQQSARTYQSNGGTQRTDFSSRSYQNKMHNYNPSNKLIPPPPTFLPQYSNENQRQDFISPHRFEKPFVFHVPTTTTPPPPTVGPAMSKLLNVPSHMVANTDNVPSFAAKMFVVREAPPEYHPPQYNGDRNPNKPKIHVEIPRTKFYCEEQKYLPGIYADAMLGCKMFHLCIPSSVGSTLTSYLCPNGTLFDQSILQCNYWYNVDCESSVKDYDANLALARSYRKINAAHLPLHGATNAGALSLLSQNMEHLQVSDPSKKLSKRRGRAFVSSKDTKNSDVNNEIKGNSTKRTDIVKSINLVKKVNKTSMSNSSSESASISKLPPSTNLENSENNDPKNNIGFSDLIIKIQNQFKTKKESQRHSKKVKVVKDNEDYNDWRPIYPKTVQYP